MTISKKIINDPTLASKFKTMIEAENVTMVRWMSFNNALQTWMMNTDDALAWSVNDSS